MVAEHTPLPGPFKRVYVEETDALRAVVAELAVERAIGVDVEMGQRVVRKPGGLQEWVHSLALIQLAGGSLSVVVDPVRCPDLAALQPLLAGPARKVFLGGGQDAALLERAGIPPLNIVDVGEVALALFGRREDGMAALANRIFGISLDKTIRRADWLVRPLNPVLISYAHRDAELTLGIYHWFEIHHAAVLRFHERVEFDPALPAHTPPWLRESITRPSQDAYAVAMDAGLDPSEHGEELGADVRAALQLASAPRIVNRLLRIAGDLGLVSALPDVLALLDSPSAMIRSSVARAVGQLADRDVGKDVLARLRSDPIVEVQKAAEAAQRELDKPRGREPDDSGDGEEPSLGDDVLAALRNLKDSIEAGES